MARGFIFSSNANGKTIEELEAARVEAERQAREARIEETGRKLRAATDALMADDGEA